MLKTIRFFLAPLLFTLSAYSNATLIVTNDWLSTELSASVIAYDMSFSESSSYAYQGAAIDLYHRVDASMPQGYGASASVRYSIGNDVTGWSGGFQSTLFSGYVTGDDFGSEHDERHTVLFETNWTFTTTEDIEYKVFMLSDESPGPISFSLVNDSTDEVVSDLLGGNSISAAGLLEAFKTYTFTMHIDRTGPDGTNGAYDGGTNFYFAIDDDFLLAADRTHHPVPETSALLLMVTGLGVVSLAGRKGKRG